MRKPFYITLAVTAALSATLLPLAVWNGNGFLVTLATTVATTCYHFLMRLLVGVAVKATFPKQIDPQNRWFRERSWEKKCYRFLRVRSWAKHVPTFRPDEFDLQKHGYGGLARQTCLSELVHELIILLGFGSLFFCFFFDDPLANLAPFLITAILAGMYDMQFVILQRYNRPMLLRLAARSKRRTVCEK